MKNVSENKVAIFTALGLEYKAVSTHLEGLRRVTQDGTIYQRGDFYADQMHWDVWIAEVGDGNEDAAVAVQRALTFIRPNLCLFVGIAGGRKDVKLGDVVAADKVYNYESGKSGSDFEPRPRSHSPSATLLSAARHARLSWDTSEHPVVYIKPIAAGGKLISSSTSDAAELIERQYGDAVAVEKEGHGFMLTANLNSVPAMVVRGISDLLDQKASTDSQGWQERAAINAANFAFDLLNAIEPDTVEQDYITWEVANNFLLTLNREVEGDFKPDLVLTMSGPGSCAAFCYQRMNSRDVPVVAAVTFPKRSADQESLQIFREIANDWLLIETSKWVVFVPHIVAQLPSGSRILLLDDRVLSGETQRKAMEILASRGLIVRRAALVCNTEASKELQYYGTIRDDDYRFPWGEKAGRSSSAR